MGYFPQKFLYPIGSGVVATTLTTGRRLCCTAFRQRLILGIDLGALVALNIGRLMAIDLLCFNEFYVINLAIWLIVPAPYPPFPAYSYI